MTKRIAIILIGHSLSSFYAKAMEIEQWPRGMSSKPSVIRRIKHNISVNQEDFSKNTDASRKYHLFARQLHRDQNLNGARNYSESLTNQEHLKLYKKTTAGYICGY